MGDSTDLEKTGTFNVSELRMGNTCPDCEGRGQLHIDSENINENFEVEKQTVITECPRCAARGSCPRVRIEALGLQQERERHHGYDTANSSGRNHGPLAAG